jgi:hypothetical protein
MQDLRSVPLDDSSDTIDVLDRGTRHGDEPAATRTFASGVLGDH